MLRALLLSFFTVVVLQLQGQQKLDYSFNHLDPSTGFPAKLVRCMSKDKDGILWMITDKGLMKYNGHTGKFFPTVKDSSSKGLLPAQPYSIYVDKTGIVWVGYLEIYLSSFDPKTETFTHYFYNEKDSTSFPPGGAVKFMEDKKGNLWIAVWGGGLARFDRTTKKFKTYRPNKEDPKTISTHNTTDVVELADGKFIIGSWEGEGYKNFIQYFDPVKEEFSKLDFDAYKYENDGERGAIHQGLRIIHFIYPADKGITWVGSFVGLICIDDNTKTMKRVSGVARKGDGWERALENSMACIVDNTGKLWVSTEVTGIMVVDPVTKKCGYINHSYKNARTISGDNIFSMYKDEENNIWICTAGGGIDVYTPLLQQFKFVDNERLEAERTNRAQGQTAIGKLMLSNSSDDVYLCHGNGLTVYNPTMDSVWRIDTKKLFERYKGRFGIKDVGGGARGVGYVHEIGGKLVICTFQGMIVYDKKTEQCTFPNYDEQYYIDINKNKHGLVATTRVRHVKGWNARLVKMDTTYKVTKELQYPEWPFKDLLGVYNGGFIQPLGEHHWFINYNHLVFYIYNDETDEFKTYCHRKPFANFPDSAVYPMTKDREDMIWIRATNGIWRFDYRTGKAENYAQKFKLGKEIVNNLTIDKDGNFWLAVKQDLIRYEPKTGETFRFYQKLGLRTGGFAQVANDINDRDEMFVLSSYGLLHFDPHALEFSHQRPDIFISGIIIKKDTMSEDGRLAFLNSDHTLAYNQNYLTFEYCTVQMYIPGPKKYEYRLIGLVSAWYNNENRNYVSYPGLAPGQYTLELRCKNVYSVKSNLFQFSFTIDPPFWKRWWFIALEILTVLGAIIFVVKRREQKLEADKLKLENTVAERTKEVVEKAKEIEIQNHIIFEKNKEMTDSIKYAERIQKALLAHTHFMNEHLPPHFVLFKPKAIVSGDFYWATQGSDNNFYLAVCDCTGHGVPGAFMSLLNISFLNEAISERNILEPNKILDFVREKLIVNLSSEHSSDGMDGTLMCYDRKKNRITYSSASNKPLLIRNGQMTELPADKMPIGKFEIERPFTLHTIELQKGDMIYFYSDGYADQFGGEKGKKFKYRQLNELLLQISGQAPERQKQILEQTLENWRGNLEQVDDVMVIGMRID